MSNISSYMSVNAVPRQWAVCAQYGPGPEVVNWEDALAFNRNVLSGPFDTMQAAEDECERLLALPLASTQHNILDVLDSLRNTMAADPRDWATDRRDAWIYGIVLGWSEGSLQELAKEHKWTPEAVNKLRLLHRSFYCAAGLPTPY